MAEEQGHGSSPAKPAGSAITIRFWGTRGSIPCSGASYLRYGGNTSCVEVRCADHLIVLDGGSGIRDLGETLIDDPPDRLDVLLTHCHFDHVCGLPFFAPFHVPTIKARLWSGHFQDAMTTEAMLKAFMMPPFFPVTPKVFKAGVEYRDFRTGDTLTLADEIKVRTAALHHPQGATGYRIDFRGASVCYLTDTEAGPDGIDRRMVDLARSADILIMDSMFTDEELSACAGWGHGSWRQAIELANAAGVGQLVLFHHHPMHDDVFMDAIAEEAGMERPGTLVAREAMTLST